MIIYNGNSDWYKSSVKASLKPIRARSLEGSTSAKRNQLKIENVKFLKSLGLKVIH